MSTVANNNELRNGIKNTGLSFFYRRKTASDWTREDGIAVLENVLKIKSAQLHKSIYYGIELIHRITRINSRGQAKFRDYAMNKLSEHSISFATQHLEMIADFNMYGQTSGVLSHYYEKCFDESTSEEKRKESVTDFVNFALVHSFITGVNTWLATIVVDVERQNDSQERIAKLYSLVAELAKSRPEIYSEIESIRNDIANDNAIPITSQFKAVPITMDDSERVYEFEREHNRVDSLIEKVAPAK